MTAMTSLCEQTDETMGEEVPSSLKQIFSDALQWNRSGAECLESCEPERALERFSMALSQHERVLELIPSARSEHRSARSGKVAEIDNSAGYGRTGTTNESHLIETNSKSKSSNIDIESDVDTDIGIDISRDMGNWFVRYESQQVILSLENGQLRREEREEDLLCCEPVRLSIETEAGLVSMFTAHANNNNEHLASDESVSNAMSLLTTVHAYNLGLANHLCGIRLLRSGDDAVPAKDSFQNGHGSSSSSSSSSVPITTPRAAENSSLTPSFYFIQAGHMYDFARRMERSRTKDDRHCTNSRRGIAEEASRITIALACLNNLADLLRRKNQIVRCVECYRQMKITIEGLLGLLNPHRGVDCLLRSYLRAFLMKARNALSRMRRRRRHDRNSNATTTTTRKTTNEEDDRRDQDPSTESAMQSLMQSLSMRFAGAA